MGLCDRSTGLCTCQDMFEGAACQRMTCPATCNSRGQCLTMSDYARTVDLGTIDSSVGRPYTYDSVWDATMIRGCSCNDGYFGPQCSSRQCPTGDDPLTGGSFVTTTRPRQFNERQTITCQATEGTFTLSFKGYTTAKIPFAATELQLKAYIEALPSIFNDYGDAVTVKYTGINTQACTSAGNTITIEFTQNFGALPNLVPNSLYLKNRNISPVLRVAKLQAGTKENAFCSNRGTCDIASGICMCSTNYDTSNGLGAAGRRGDCGYATVAISTCPGDIACSGHGVCEGSPTYTCLCSAGWTGADCSEMTCPYGFSWFSYPSKDETAHDTRTECSDMGLCDRSSGVCACMAGFEGAACQLMSCPGSPISCTGHGTCLTMKQQGQYRTINGELAATSYGATPNNPLTWDAERVMGCFCDDGYGGYDCSEMTCPTGDDSETEFQTDEIQSIKCELPSTVNYALSTLTLGFRKQTAAILTASSSTLDIKQKLEALSTVGTVNVCTSLTVSGTSKYVCTNDDDYTTWQADTTYAKYFRLCNTQANTAYVHFLTEHGDLPMLKSKTENIETITAAQFAILEQQKGTTENIECNGRGLCDRTTGECTCFEGYSSSDGMKNEGDLGDCGYKQPVVPPATTDA